MTIGAARRLFVTFAHQGLWYAYSPRDGVLIRSHDKRAAGEAAATRFSITSQRPRRGFTSLTFFLTSACQLRCVYCYARAGETRPRVADARLIEDACHYFCQQYEGKRTTMRVGFHGGGEQTLAFPLLKFAVETARSTAQRAGFLGCKFLITTNGVLPPAALDYLVANDFSISVSLDGVPEIHNAQRPLPGGDSHHEAALTVHRLVSQQRRFSVRPTVTGQFLSRLHANLQHFSSLGIKYIILEPVCRAGRAETMPAKDFPDPLEFAEALLEAITVAEGLGVTISNSYIRYLQAGRYDFYCGAGSGQTMAVTSDGLISGCYEVTHADSVPEFIYGQHVPEQRTFRVFGEKLETLRGRELSHLACRECNWGVICGGGCPIRAFRRTGSILEVEPDRCLIANRIYPVLLARMAELSERSAIHV